MKKNIFKEAAKNKAYKSKLAAANRAKKAAGVAWRKAVQSAKAKSRRRK
jgi:hypothetical protein